MPVENQPVLHPHSATPMGGCIGLGCFSLFWNGITGFVSFQALSDGFGFFSIFLFLFFIPFWLVGLLMFGLWIASLGALFNARPTLEIGRGRVELGQSVPFSFDFGKGGLKSPRSVQITLEGREEATFQRGTDTVTDKSPFYYAVVYESPTFEKSGQGEFSLPLDSMHTLEARNNKILWILKIHAPINGWTDIQSEWKLRVEPRSN